MPKTTQPQAGFQISALLLALPFRAVIWLAETSHVLAPIWKPLTEEEESAETRRENRRQSHRDRRLRRTKSTRTNNSLRYSRSSKTSKDCLQIKHQSLIGRSRPASYWSFRLRLWIRASDWLMFSRRQSYWVRASRSYKSSINVKPRFREILERYVV